MKLELLSQQIIYNPVGESTVVSTVDKTDAEEFLKKSKIAKDFSLPYIRRYLLDSGLIMEMPFFDDMVRVFESYEEWLLFEDNKGLFTKISYLPKEDEGFYYSFVLQSQLIKDIFNTKTTIRIDKYPDPLYSLHQIEENGNYLYLQENGHFNSAMWYIDEDNFKEYLFFYRGGYDTRGLE